MAAALAIACFVAMAAPAGAQGTAPAARKNYTPADVHFMQGMIGHHEQALVMSALAASRAGSDRVKLLAYKIDISQRDEIDAIKRWLEDRKLSLPDSGDHSMMHMPGMLTPEQMKRLEASKGAEFDRLFLTLMISHHEGALKMVEELFASPGAGQEPELYRFATDVDADQRAEIERMQHLLNNPPDRSTR